MTLFELSILLIAVAAALRSHSPHQLLVLVLATTLACIVMRFIWKKPFFIAWAALRGADSLVISLAIPLTIKGGAPFPSRDLIIFVTFGVIFMTLVVQGFSLAPLVRRLQLRGDGAEGTEERLARIVMADAALERLREIAKDRSAARHCAADAHRISTAEANGETDARARGATCCSHTTRRRARTRTSISAAATTSRPTVTAIVTRSRDEHRGR